MMDCLTGDWGLVSASRRWAGVLVVMVSVLVAGTPSVGQLAQLANAGEAEDVGPAKARMADELLRVVHHVVASEGGAAEAQVRQAEVLLEMAASLNPDDADTWRLLAEIADRDGNEERRDEAYREYLRLRPDNQRAMLEVIRANVRDVQVLEERATRLRGLIGRMGDRLPGPVRSRLYADLASVAVERGETEGVDENLTRALGLDPSNARATQMRYNRLVDRTDDLSLIAPALIDLVKANAPSPTLRLQLASLLFQEGAYAEAAEQFQMSVVLSGQLIPPQQFRAWMMSQAVGYGPLAAIRLGLQMEQILAGEAAAAERAEGAAEGAVTRQELTLPLPLELVRLAVSATDADHLGQAGARELPDTALTASWGLVDRWFRERIGLDDDARRVQYAKWASLFCPDLTVAGAALEGLPEDNAEAIVARGWWSLRRGEPAEARAAFSQVKTDGFAQLGYAMLYYLDGDRQLTRRLLHAIVRNEPNGLPGMVAALRLRQLGDEPRPTDLGQSLRAMMNREPRTFWITRFDEAPWVVVSMAADEARFDYLDPLSVNLVIRNTLRLPLGIGAGLGVPDSAVLTMRLSAGGIGIGNRPQKVVEIDRKLTLGGREVLEVPVRLDRSELGDLLVNNPTTDFNINVEIVLGPTVRGDGTIVPLPYGSKATVRNLLVRSVSVNGASVSRWFNALADGTPDERLVALATLLKVHANPPGDRPVPASLEELPRVLNNVFADMDPLMQAWTALFLPPAFSEEARPMLPVYQVLQRSEDPLTRIVYVLRHVQDPDSPTLAAAMRHEDPKVRAFAEAHAEMLRLYREQMESHLRDGALQDGDDGGADGAVTPSDAGMGTK